MDINLRRNSIISILKNSDRAVSGRALADRLNVSRQIIVSDITVLRAEKHDIISTNLGYILNEKKSRSRVFKVKHTDDEVIRELEIIVDCGGCIEDVFIYHRVYGVVSAKLNIKSRYDIECFMGDIKSGKSSLLKNVTSNYHYHTVSANSEEILDLIYKKLSEAGFLTGLLDYEPINFGE